MQVPDYLDKQNQPTAQRIRDYGRVPWVELHVFRFRTPDGQWQTATLNVLSLPLHLSIGLTLKRFEPETKIGDSR